MLLSTTSEVPGHTITAYKGMVISQVTAGRHLGKDVLAGVRDVFGGRSKSLEKDLESARQQALSELAAKAQQIGANAVVGIRLDMENVAGSMLLFVGQGTAVTATRG
ncbi:MAG: YbjQ family protein [bacterium]|nr:YbjQ family protein [Acidimicrobiia bacterium]MCY4651514.1 YbjQ family protein [bacterium]